MKNRGMGSVFQPTYTERGPDGSKVTKMSATWRISYYLHGKRHKESVHSTNRGDAVRLLKQRIADVQAGKPVGAQVERTTLADLLEMVEADYKANGRRSLERMLFASSHLRDFLEDDRKAREITSDTLTSYAAHRLEEKAKPSTVNYELAVLRRGFRLAKRAGKVASCPEAPMLHVDNVRKGFFERDQYEAVLSHLPEFLRPVAAVAYITGWRTKSELLTRQWRHVDFANGWLRLEPGESKNSDARNFPFTPELRRVLEAQRELVRQIEKAQGVIIPWVFIHPPGTARCEAGGRIRNFRGGWAKACKAAGLPGRLVHDLRRTAVRNLERAGVSRSAAMKLTGHKTEAVYRRYAIVDSTMLQEAVDKLGALHEVEANSPRSVQVVPVSARK